MYEQRFRQAVEMYRRFLNDEEYVPRRTAANKANRASTPTVRKTAAPERSEQKTKFDDPHAPGMITYPFPIRPGLQGKITLPEDLTRREAERIAAFIGTLAFDEAPEVTYREQPLTITARREDIS